MLIPAYNHRYLDIITRCFEECSNIEDEEKILRTIIGEYRQEDEFLKNMFKLYGAHRVEMYFDTQILELILRHLYALELLHLVVPYMYVNDRDEFAKRLPYAFDYYLNSIKLNTYSNMAIIRFFVENLRVMKVIERLDELAEQQNQQRCTDNRVFVKLCQNLTSSLNVVDGDHYNGIRIEPHKLLRYLLENGIDDYYLKDLQQRKSALQLLIKFSTIECLSVALTHIDPKPYDNVVPLNGTMTFQDLDDILFYDHNDSLINERCCLFVSTFYYLYMLGWTIDRLDLKSRSFKAMNPKLVKCILRILIMVLNLGQCAFTEKKNRRAFGELIIQTRDWLNDVENCNLINDEDLICDFYQATFSSDITNSSSPFVPTHKQQYRSEIIQEMLQQRTTTTNHNAVYWTQLNIDTNICSLNYIKFGENWSDTRK
ncbi:unnamed protein product [Didymodactylos carnosus]|uniref:Uncharacterized protein n=1 Tax=Didymodactylos carnosus TaxID=1234261 RepID=A0A813PJ00_9BILA|nr:unnamed protein product [Didymodactylos carnosus]CAF0754140.1 unnamed protein product [Didymodactylos carnosus]CAF3493135.1 unnamed protein product [Didymodactylos carnosus]CAF3534274.1 unnamed protein product [Didymodactylos carnosus]